MLLAMRARRLPIGILVSLAIIAITAGILYAHGRSPICTCGYVELFWWGPKGSAGESQHLFDIYSGSHILHGLIFYFLIWLIGRGHMPLWVGLILATLVESGWEQWENSNYIITRYRTAGFDYNGDSIVNSVGDMLSMVVGFLIAAVMPIWTSLLLLVGTELGMAWLIHDNLTLNIIGVVHPIEEISKWQDMR